VILGLEGHNSINTSILIGTCCLKAAQNLSLNSGACRCLCNTCALKYRASHKYSWKLRLGPAASRRGGGGGGRGSPGRVAGAAWHRGSVGLACRHGHALLVSPGLPFLRLCPGFGFVCACFIVACIRNLQTPHFHDGQHDICYNPPPLTPWPLRPSPPPLPT